MPQQRLGRLWGTRFDSLTSSDSLSLSSNPESVVASSHPVSSPPRSISADEGNSVHDSHDRILPDASIFIGSLPANIEYADLTNMLAQHLSEHPQVKGIKVVRDSKGGTCAFIQCQDSEEASVLMHNLHVAAPQPFLGRCLRYEPARAFRTLLISYRSPRQYFRQREAPRKANFLPTEDPRFIELQLPNAMRIVRTPGTKHLAVLYDSAALDTPPPDPSLLLVPLLYDAESLLRITSVFGVVEYFGPYALENENGQVSTSLPFPHDGPRSPVMDPGCWKVKWAHRDDCVSALVTLRRIPHLTVTWAHQSNMTPREQGLYSSRSWSAFQASHSWRNRGTGPPFRSVSNFLPASHTFPAFRPEGFSVVERSSDVKVADPGCDVWRQETPAVPNNRNHPLSRSSRPRALSLTHDRPQPEVSLPSRESTGQLSFTSWESTNRTRWADHIESMEFKGGPSVTGPNHSSSPYLHHHIASSDSHTSHEGDSQEIDAAISHTPGFRTSSPRTPGSFMLRTPTTASYMGDFQSMSFRDYDSHGSLLQLSQEKRDDHVVDPTTIFVGGLEMFGPNAWDEGKVRALFSKYGGIEAIKVIRPSNKRSAFAFVKFNNTEAPARAVKAEHNRMLDGRLIRVQLRDWNPAYRPSWRPGHHKVSYSQPHSANDDRSADPKLHKPGIVDIAAHMSDLQLADSDSPTRFAPLSSGEACDLNEVQDETSIPPPEVSSTNDDPACDSKKEVRRSLDIKQSEPVLPDTTLVSSQTSATPAPALPGTYSAPTIQYYQGWIPNYAPQFPYQMPFAGPPYPGYPFPSLVAPPPPQSGGSESNGTPSNTPIPFGPASNAYPTFMRYPPPLGQNSDPGQATAGLPGVANNPTIIHTQAPLIPTGFIQGDHGMLVPVYPPDALNQYMTGNQDQGQVPTNSGSVESPVTWRPYPPPPICPQTVILHSYINPPLTAPPHPLGPHAWIPPHAYHGVTPSLGNPHGVPGRRISSALTGGPASIPMASTFERGLVPPRRQYRRDNHVQHHKNNCARGTAGRYGKAPFDASRSPSDIPPASVSQSSVPDTSIDADWQRSDWNTDQGNFA
ncbi:hypothetical protein L210DRAFT_975593 [Boletus edulis BED1]|uniref:RRM domain-containing protein n=1 Tax=Boletus edulis BED1 TaxID=1328754 RepID=A0AAD4BLP0_BOLED|nr:hypothetical protein L210DRAFT_975593 [Boletus edulis BED1]